MINIKGLNCSLLNKIGETINAKGMVEKLMSRCENLATRMGKEVSTGGTLVSKAPTLLNPEYLFKFQIISKLKCVYVLL